VSHAGLNVEIVAVDNGDRTSGRCRPHAIAFEDDPYVEVIRLWRDAMQTKAETDANDLAFFHDRCLVRSEKTGTSVAARATAGP